MTKKYRLMVYIPADTDDQKCLMDTYEEALVKQVEQELLFPENLYRIEEVDDEEPEAP